MRHLSGTSRGAALLAGLAIGLAACGAGPATSPSGSGAAAPTDAGTATGGTVRIASGGSPDSLNPGNGLLS